MPDPFDRLERFYDAVPRDRAHTEEVGGLVLFAREGAGWPFYARPRLDATEPPSAADVIAVRARQREIGVPEAFEWVHETTPELLAVARSAGLAVLEAPLMVLDPAALPAADGVPVRLLDPDAPSFAADLAVGRGGGGVGFGTRGRGGGPGAPPDRDAATVPYQPEELAEEQRLTRAGRHAHALAATPEEGALAAGVYQRVDDVAEIVGVATLPAARRRGLAAAVTGALARHARDHGVDLVFLSAGSADVARVYARLGFRRIGTACIAEPAPVPSP
ncbi:GNAT family N-acetyltransferase [Actinomycetes bacterium KLBMP 9797]